MATFGKWFIQLLLPYIIDGLKYAYRVATLKKAREARAKKKEQASQKYEEAKTEQEVKESYENLP